jgi:hypothetical protein
MAIDKESVKKLFPNLYKELESGEVKVSIDALRKNPDEAEAEIIAGEEPEVEAEECYEQEPRTEMPDKLRHFNPQAVDFIRRCDTDAQAEEIISYLEKKREITCQYAEELRSKLKINGVRGFGSKKEEFYYFKEGGIY